MLWPVSPPNHNEHGQETGSSESVSPKHNKSRASLRLRQSVARRGRDFPPTFFHITAPVGEIVACLVPIRNTYEFIYNLERHPPNNYQRQ